jgi:hypothetical protein
MTCSWHEAIRSSKPRPAPWELSCLAHLMPHNLDIAKRDEESLANCKEFMLTDYTFISSWDSSKTSTVGQW